MLLLRSESLSIDADADVKDVPTLHAAIIRINSPSAAAAIAGRTAFRYRLNIVKLLFVSDLCKTFFKLFIESVYVAFCREVCLKAECSTMSCM